MVTTSKSNVLFFYPENIPSAMLLNSTMKKILIDLRKSSSVNESQWTVKSILNNAKVSCCYHSIERSKKDNKDKSESEILATIRNRLSVIIFGTDSVSRLNFIRTQPKTYQYLTKELKAIEYKGYNKIGDNTFPNIIALLTGNLWTDEFAQKCYRKFVKDARRYSEIFDNCPIIWKDFQSAGYTTALLEILLSYSHDFQVTYKNDLTFSHVWATALTHDNMNQGVYADEPNLKYLKSLKEDGIFNKTILFFISDHGIRFGKFRETDWGRYEENLPSVFIVLPEWFHERFPIASKNLQENSLRLSTPLDLHETFKDILYEKYSDKNHVLKNSSDKERRISLFQVITMVVLKNRKLLNRLPITRTCTDIGMPLQYCACQNYVQLEDTDDETTYSGIVGHLVTVQASYEPGNALIETALIWEKTNKNSSFTVFGEISRINRYGDQSKCVSDNIKLYGSVTLMMIDFRAVFIKGSLKNYP
ncbi:hypothetical protein Avbf_09195 [Armadillidium vulgare]|nr:hypothetical protein Avbf_09195 [Armadillidium vulgare]